MSGKGKGFESKTEAEDSGDCGYLSGEVSGPISEPLSGPIGDQSSSDSSTAAPATKHVDISDRKTVLISDQQVDSGVIDYLSADLSNVDLSDTTPTEQVRAVPDLPPIDILFQQDEQGDTQLHIAAAHRCVKAISLLTRLCPDKSWLDIPNDDGQTALHLAVLTGDAVVVRMLAIEGASLAARDDWGRTPLHLATQIDSIPCIHALMTPVSGNPIDLDSTVNMWNSDGQTCVHVAAKSGNIKMMQVLVYYNADINAREGLCGRTALHIAAARGDAGMVRYLVESARAAVAPRDYARRTPRRLARPHPALAAELRAAALRAAADDDSDTDTDTDDEVDSETDSEDEEALLEALVRIRGSGNRVMQAV